MSRGIDRRRAIGRNARAGIRTIGGLAALALAIAPAALAAPNPPLDHEGRWITDSEGRAVVLRGWNMVYKVGSYRP
ncbi:MAG: hypothetical protein H0T10_03830, partial [Actinobacteria bacterium]|nr:hypothetical protein [Actinomycetota bacterium]